MPYEQLIDRVARTNAYPQEHGLPEGWLAGDLEPDAQGSSIVATIQELKPTQQKPSGPNWSRIAAIAAAVVAIAVAVFLFREDPDVVEEPTTTTAAATLEERRIQSVERIVGLLYDDDTAAMADAVSTVPEPLDFLRTHHNSIAVHADLIEIESCENVNLFQARCTILEIDDIVRAFGLEQVRSHVTLFFEQDGEVIMGATFTPNWPSNIDRFFTWFTETKEQPEVCATEGVLEGLPADPETCWATVLSFVPEFMETDLYVPGA